MNVLKRVLVTSPHFIRLMQAMFAVGVGFNAIEVTAEQFGLLVLATESGFQYLSFLAFKRDIDELDAAVVDKAKLEAISAQPDG